MKPESRKTSWTAILGTVAALLGAGAAVAALFITDDNNGTVASDSATKSSSQRARSEGPSLDDWASRANAACARAYRELEQLPNVAGNAAIFIEQAPTLIAQNEGLVQQLQRLEAPTEHQAKIREFIGRISAVGDGTRDAWLAIDAQDPERLRSVNRETKRNARAGTELAGRLGATDCPKVL